MAEGLELTALERGVLELERDWPLMPVPRLKRDLIRARLSISPTQYYRLLTRVLDTQAAARIDPLTVRRLQRRRLGQRRAAFVSEAPRQRRPR